MKSALTGKVAFVSLALSAVIGCINPQEENRLNSPTCSDAENPMAETFAYHSDAGLIADMCIADIHFVPHTAQLSGIGETRLERYAEILSEHGGKLAYDTGVRDKNLLDARLQAARDFLAQCTPTNNIEIALGLPQGRGMTHGETMPGQAVAKQPEPRGTAYKLGKGVQGSISGGQR